MGHVVYPLIVSQHATRFIIFQGAFESVSLAIYGDLVAERPTPPVTYRPNPLPLVERAPLTGSLDPANAKDPTLLARQLLELTPESPSLAIVVRLMYCVKPSDVDWEHPDFPYLHVDLGQDIADFSLEKAVKLTTEQISDELTSDQLSHFADKISEVVGPPVCLSLLEDETISTLPCTPRTAISHTDFHVCCRILLHKTQNLPSLSWHVDSSNHFAVILTL